MPPQRGYVACLDGHGRSQLILQSQVATHGVWCLVVKLDSTQPQATRIHRSRTQRSARKAGLKGSGIARACSSATRECDRCMVVWFRVIEVELERIVFTEVWREPTVFESVEEDAKPSTNNQLGSRLIGEAETGREVGFL